MLVGMETTRFIALAATGGTPGHPVSPDDELRALLEAQRLTRDLSRSVAAHTTSPIHAALFARAAEDAHRTAAHTQLLAADAARRTLAHELPEAAFAALAAIHQDPGPYITGTAALPADPATVPTCRPVFKDTTEFLTGFLHIGYYDARERVRAIDRLLPGTDIHGIHTPPKFPLLAGDLANGTADPGQIGNAARKLEQLAPHIGQHPDPALLAGTLEDQVAESVRREDPGSTAKLLTGIKKTLTKDATAIPEHILRAAAGLVYRGTTDGLGEFVLRTLPADTEVLLALCASTDNPRTNAGNRDALLAQALATPATTGPAPAESDPHTTDATDRSSAQSTTTDPGTAGTPAGFPDFLTDPATGQPLTDPDTARKLSLDPEGTGTPDPTGYGPDGLTPPQRHLQGLMNLIKAAGKPATGKKTTGLPSPATLVIATLGELRGLANTHGITGRGQPLTPAELRQPSATAASSPQSWAANPASWTSAKKNASSPTTCAKPSWASTAAASCPAAPCPRNTAKSTTSNPSPPAARPPSTTAPPSAAPDTTASTPGSSGSSATTTGSSASSCPNSWTPNKNPGATPTGATTTPPHPCSEPQIRTALPVRPRFEWTCRVVRCANRKN